MGLLRRIFNLLGGPRWEFDENDIPERTFDPELALTLRRDYLYNSDNNGRPQNQVARSDTVYSLPELLEGLMAVDFHRLGGTEYPAEVPVDLTDDDENAPTMILHGQADFNAWQLRQMDAISGAYPMRLKYRNAEGDEEEIVIANQAEALLELLGLSLGIASDTDILTQVGIKTLAEGTKTQVLSLRAADFSEAIAEYMGFRMKEDQRDLPLTYSPGKDSLADVLTEGRMKVRRYEFADKSQLTEVLTQLLIASQIIKSALTFPLDGLLPGERMKEDQDGLTDQGDQVWAEFLQSIRDRSGITRNQQAPQPEIRDLADEGAP